MTLKPVTIFQISIIGLEYANLILGNKIEEQLKIHDKTHQTAKFKRTSKYYTGTTIYILARAFFS